MIPKKTLTTTGSEYISFKITNIWVHGNVHGKLSRTKFPNPNTTFGKIHFTQAPTIVSHWKAMQLGSFIHLSIETPP